MKFRLGILVAATRPAARIPTGRVAAFFSPSARAARLLLCSGILLAATAGCQSPATVRAKPAMPPATVHVQPMDASVGRVTSVNLPLKFVVLDFSLSRLPQAGDALELTRNGKPVGELKTGFHARESTVVADILSGVPEVGDEARPLPR